MSEVSRTEHAAHLLEQGKNDQKATRMMTFPDDESLDESSTCSTTAPLLDSDDDSDIGSTVTTTSTTSYKEQFVEAQKFLLSTQEESRLRYEQLEKEMEELKRLMEEDALTINKLTTTVEQLTTELTDSNDKVAYELQTRRALVGECDSMKNELQQLSQDTKDDENRSIAIMEENERIREQIGLEEPLDEQFWQDDEDSENESSTEKTLRDSVLSTGMDMQMMSTFQNWMSGDYNTSLLLRGMKTMSLW